MGFFGRIFNRHKKSSDTHAALSHELVELKEIDQFMRSLLRGEHFVSRKEYSPYIRDHKHIIEWFEVLESSGTLNNYCSQYGMTETEVKGIITRFSNFQNLIDAQNDQYIKEKIIDEAEYLDNILKESDPNIVLDDDQREAVLSDEDYSLVIAGAGAGKTTTVAAKVKYLVDKQGVDPKQILVISFTNKAVNELKQRIIGDLHIECPIATFHSTGNAILHINDPQKLNIVDGSKLYYVLQDYFRTSVLRNETVVNNLIMFFASYFDAPYDEKDLMTFFNQIAKSNFTTMKSELDEFKRQVVDAKTKRTETIQSEIMRSRQEVEIANFLYLNGIDYEYEPLYKYDIEFARKPYTPDFIIKQDDNAAYLEHFGITEDGRNNRYSSDELATYKNAIKEKIALHNQHGTTLIYTYSGYNDRRPLVDHLKEILEDNGFELRPRSNKEILEKLVSSEENRYIRKLVNLICRFISNFKTNGYTVDEFNRMYHATQNVRTRLFLNICQDCFIEYERWLKEHDSVDFQDLINESARVLRNIKEMKQKLDFKYIIVDEYQDISRQRFDLVKELSEVTDAKIIAVGDDWQSIYAFSGSDITLFTKFAEKMGYAKLLKIVRTYRNSQEVIDIAGGFIQKNKEQIDKDLISSKHIDDPVIIYTYDSKYKDKKGDNRSGVNYAIAHAIETALEQIMEYNRAANKQDEGSILLLGRFGFDGDRLERSGLFEYITRGSKIKSVKYPKLDITFMTAHSSKGLGYDNVIVVNGRNETYGFPSKIEDDPVLSFVVKDDKSIDYAEERRLFYVALTRTRNRVFFIAPEQNPSEFLLELKADYKNVSLRGNWNNNPELLETSKKVCPICGYPMQLRYKPSYGLRLYICTNEPEICDFMTNDIRAGKISVIKCDKCRDGYLIARKGRDEEYMLGCTNYKKDGTGCSKMLSKKAFYSAMGIKDDIPVKPIEIVKGIDIKPKIIGATEDNTDPINISEQNGETTRYNRLVIIKKPNMIPVLYKENDLNDIIVTILQCISDVSEIKFYGTNIIVDILRGADSAKFKSEKLNELEEYDKLSSIGRADLYFIIDWLIKHKFLLQTKGKYPVLHPTYTGVHYNENISRRMIESLKTELEK